MLKPHTQSFIACLIAVILAALAIWFKSGTVNLELIIFFITCLYGTYLLISFFIVKKVKTRLLLQRVALVKEHRLIGTVSFLWS
jgi:uncharacterized membrane protein YqaE (UPF0057 family)